MHITLQKKFIDAEQGSNYTFIFDTEPPNNLLNEAERTTTIYEFSITGFKIDPYTSTICAI